MSASVLLPADSVIRALIQVVRALPAQHGRHVTLATQEGQLRIAAQDEETGESSEFSVPIEGDLALPPVSINALLLKKALTKGASNGIPDADVRIGWDDARDPSTIEVTVGNFMPTRLSVTKCDHVRHPDLTGPAVKIDCTSPVFQYIANSSEGDCIGRYVRFAEDNEVFFIAQPEGSATAVRLGKALHSTASSHSVVPDQFAVIDIPATAMRALGRGVSAEITARKISSKKAGGKRSEILGVQCDLRMDKDTGFVRLSLEGGFSATFAPVAVSAPLDRVTVGDTRLPLPNTDAAVGGGIEIRTQPLIAALEWACEGAAGAALRGEDGTAPLITVVANHEGFSTVRVSRPGSPCSPVLHAEDEVLELHIDSDGGLQPAPALGASGEAFAVQADAVELVRLLRSIGRARKVVAKSDQGALMVVAQGVVARCSRVQRSTLQHPDLRLAEITNLSAKQARDAHREIEWLRRLEESRSGARHFVDPPHESHRARRLADRASQAGIDHRRKMLVLHREYPYHADGASAEDLLRIANGNIPIAEHERGRLREIAMMMHYPVALSWAKKAIRRSNPIDREDLYAIATAALWKAVVAWKPDGGAPVVVLAKRIWRSDLATLVATMGGYQLTMPDSSRSGADRIQAAIGALEIRNGRYPTPDEVLSLVADWAFEQYPENLRTNREDQYHLALEHVRSVMENLASARSISFDSATYAGDASVATRRPIIPIPTEDELPSNDYDFDPAGGREQSKDRKRLERFMSALSDSHQEAAVRTLLGEDPFPLTRGEWALYMGFSPATGLNRTLEAQEQLAKHGIRADIARASLGI